MRPIKTLSLLDPSCSGGAPSPLTRPRALPISTFSPFMEEELAFSVARKEDADGAAAATDIAAITTIEEKEETDGAIATDVVAITTDAAPSACAHGRTSLLLLPMEEKQEADEASTTNAAAIADVEEKEETNGSTEADVAPPITGSPSRRAPTGKKRGALSLFRAVFFTFRRRSPSKKASGDQEINDDEKPTPNEAIWKNLVGGVRPLHLHQLEYYTSTHPPPPPPPPPLGHEVYHDVLLAPPSPARSEGMTSRYASAEDLQKLDGSHDGEEENTAMLEGIDECPNAIDMQAEEFIAKFYEQMRLQRLGTFDLAN